MIYTLINKVHQHTNTLYDKTYVILAPTHLTSLTPLTAPVIRVNLVGPFLFLQTELVERFTTHIAVQHLNKYRNASSKHVLEYT